MTRERDGEATECVSTWIDDSSLIGDSVVREFDDAEPPSIALVIAVSELKDVAPTTLTPPLHDVIDPEALDRFFDRLQDSPTNDGVLELTEYGCRIQVYADGYVEVCEDAHAH